MAIEWTLADVGILAATGIPAIVPGPSIGNPGKDNKFIIVPAGTPFADSNRLARPGAREEAFYGSHHIRRSWIAVRSAGAGGRPGRSGRGATVPGAEMFSLPFRGWQRQRERAT
jgi:hypothetical protein